METRKAIFAAGCFWGVEEAFARMPGVLKTQVGYTGGKVDDPDYRTVCSGTTDHAEAVEVEYDPGTITFRALADAFFALHDPTTLNRQGPDVGTQYRSGVFYLDEEQRKEAEAAKAAAAASGRYRKPIVTEITPASAFWRAEEYHQRYLAKRGLPGCHL